MHNNTVTLFRDYAKPLFTPESIVLEIGPDPNKRLAFPYKRLDLTGIIAHPYLTFVSQEYYIPVPANSYDIVLSTNVMEHVRKPWTWIKELARVCKPGGYVITICPANWPYHEDPIDCFRIYPEGMRSLYEESGLKLVELGMYGSNPLTNIEKEAFPHPEMTIVDTIGIGQKCITYDTNA